MSLRGRLFASYLLVVVLAALVLGLFVAQAMEQRSLATLRTDLGARATLLAELLRPELARGRRTPQLTDRVRRLDRETGMRITLLTPHGEVLADSEHDPVTMGNHASRAEVRQALAAGTGADLRRSSTLQVGLLYLAQRVPRRGAAVGVVRVAVPLHQVEVASRQIRNRVLLFGALAVALALLLSWRFSRRLSAAISDLDRAARSFSQGHLDAHAHPRGHDELTSLAESFNAMAARLRTSVRELREEKQQAETLLARLSEAVLVTDAQGRISLCNQAAERVFGVPAAQALGRGLVDVTKSYPLDAAFRQALATGETAVTELQVLFPRPCVLEATVAAMGEVAPVGAVAVLHDVTELRRLEAVRREFVSNASHELQTPVTAIKAMAETLLTGGAEDPALLVRFLGELDRQAERLGALVRDLLDLARLEAGPLPLHPTEFGLRDVVQSLLHSFAPLAAPREIALQEEVPSELRVRADRSALHRVLSNLLDNAIKYTDAGGRVGVRAGAAEGVAEIVIWDTGLGIPSSDLSRIFERFYRVDKARSRRLGGTGLGLSIVKHLLEAMGGTVSVASELGHGSTFTLRLPLAQTADSTGGPFHRRDAEHAERRREKKQ